MRTKLFKGLAGLFIAVFAVVVSITIGISAFNLTPYINDYFGTMSSKVVNIDADPNADFEYYKSAYSNVDEMIDAKIANIKKTVGEGIVLLKNENREGTQTPMLPLAASTKVTLLGDGSVNEHFSLSSGASSISNGKEICAQVPESLVAAGLDVNQTMVDFYEANNVERSTPRNFGSISGTMRLGQINPSSFTATETNSFSQYNDAAIVFLTRDIGEGFDYYTGESGQTTQETSEADAGQFPNLELTPNERALLATAKANFDNIIVVLNTDNAIAVSGMDKDPQIKAILQVGGLGWNGAEALAEVITGKINPSGRLAYVYAQNSLSAPATQDLGHVNFSNADEIKAWMVENTGVDQFAQTYVMQKESIYVGYRYYETRYEDYVLGVNNASSLTGMDPEIVDRYDTATAKRITPDEWNYDNSMGYTFGYGMSYTTFTQEFVGEPSYDGDGRYTFTVRVTNTGEKPGKDVVQIWAQTPYTQTDKDRKVEKSAVQLAGFEKTGEAGHMGEKEETVLLGPGDHEDVKVVVDIRDIASWDSLANDGTGGYILSEGEHYFALGNGAHDALNNILAAKDLTAEQKARMDGAGDASKVWSFEQSRRDEETYSVSEYTDATLENQLEDLDINYWDEDVNVTYLSRSDWTGTFPRAIDGETNGRTSTKLAVNEKMKLELSNVREINKKDYSDGTLAYEASLDYPIEADTNYQVSMMMGEPFDSEQWDSILNQISLDDLSHLIAAANSFTYKCDSITYPGTVDGDGPTGFAGNLDYKGGTIAARIYEGEVVLSATFSKKCAAQRGRFMGEDGLYLDKTSIWGPGANLHRNPYSGRSGEYYSEDPMLAFLMGEAQVRTFQDEKGCIACPKHFAFNDQEANRYALSTFLTEQEGREIVLRCFQGAFAEGGALGTMTSFGRVGCTYVGAHQGLLTDILRGEWGFEGYAITDMAAASWTYMQGYESLLAGTDCFDTTDYDRFGSVDFTPEQLREDPLLLAAARQAAKRILYANVNSNAMNGVSKNAKIVGVIPWWQGTLIGISVGLGAIAAALTALAVIFAKKDEKLQGGKA